MLTSKALLTQPVPLSPLPETGPQPEPEVGRLIRAETDRGVMAILDSRINTKRYGPQVIASLRRVAGGVWTLAGIAVTCRNCKSGFGKRYKPGNAACNIHAQRRGEW